MQKIDLAVALTSLAFAGASPASADILELSSIETGGGVSYPGGSAPLTGQLVEGGLYQINRSSTYSIFGNTPYTTGPFSGSDATDWFFGPGGSLSITGEVLDSAFNVVIPTTTLLTGSFSGISTLTYNSSSILEHAVTFDASIDATVSSTLAYLLGIPSVQYVGSLTFETGPEFVDSPPPDPLACGLCIDELDIKLNPVPELGSWLLLGSVLGLFALPSWGLFRSRKRATPPQI
jgi:hypothetical protein